LKLTLASLVENINNTLVEKEGTKVSSPLHVCRQVREYIKSEGFYASLKEAGIIEISQGKSGIELAKGLDKITFYDVYMAVNCVDDEGLFHFHENPNIKCPVGRNIHLAMDEKLQRVQDTMENELRHITVADVAADIKRVI
jgi:DNA-binding IscR family transcriptional regulator